MSRFWHEAVQNPHPHALVIVVDSQGSAPGKTGFKMVVCADGRVTGTIGGGIMELELARELAGALTAGRTGSWMLTRIHNNKAPVELRSGMICAGSQTMVVHILGSDDYRTTADLANAELVGEDLSLISTPAGIRCAHHPSEPAGLTRGEDGDWCYVESISTPICYIIGAGHVGLAIARTLSLLDFRLLVIDDRPNLAQLARFTCPTRILPYEQLDEVVLPGPQSHAVIVTTAAASDAVALTRLAPMHLAYLGLMGSKAKLRFIFDQVRAAGVDPDHLARVQAPMGLPINNRTPAEIAVSLAAQIIKLRNG